MKKSRRLKRSGRGGKGLTSASLNMVALMDIFTILVFFLLVNSASSDVMEPPKNIKLPDSTVDAAPRETVVVMITPEDILVQGQPVAKTKDVLKSKNTVIAEVRDRLLLQKKKVIGIKTQIVSESQEVTVLAHRTVPFRLMKKIMSSCTSAGYSKISLAVIQKAKGKG